MKDLLSIMPVEARARVFQVLDKNTRKCYHIFSIMEVVEPDMEEYGAPYLFDRASEYFDDNKQLKLYYTESRMNLTCDFLDNPIGHLCVVDDKGHSDILEFYNDEFMHIPTGNLEYLLVDTSNLSGFKDILSNTSGPTWIKTYADRNHAVLDLVKSEPILEKSLRELSLKHIGKDLTLYTEYIGNIIVERHHPEIRWIGFRGSRLNNQDGIILETGFRTAGRPDLNLEICSFEQEDCVTADTSIDIPTSGFLQHITLPTSSQNSIVKVFDGDGTLIYYSPLSSFVKAINVEISVPSRKVGPIQYTDNKGNLVITQGSQKWSLETMKIGETRSKPDHYYSEGHKQREVYDHEKNGEFVFFDGDLATREANRKRAIQIVGKYLSGARTRCYICDDFFGARDFETFVLPIKFEDVEVRIINDKEHCRQECRKPLAEIIGKYNHSLGREKVICRCLKGDKSVLHDRIIVADDTVYAVGASFNELGRRASVMYKVPHYAGLRIISTIENWWGNSAISEDIRDCISD